MQSQSLDSLYFLGFVVKIVKDQKLKIESLLEAIFKIGLVMQYLCITGKVTRNLIM